MRVQMLTVLVQAYGVSTNTGSWIFFFFSSLNGKLRNLGQKQAQDEEYDFETLQNDSSGLQSPFCGIFTECYVSRKGNVISASISTPVTCHHLHKVFGVNQCRPYADGVYNVFFFLLISWYFRQRYFTWLFRFCRTKFGVDKKVGGIVCLHVGHRGQPEECGWTS